MGHGTIIVTRQQKVGGTQCQDRQKLPTMSHCCGTVKYQKQRDPLCTIFQTRDTIFRYCVTGTLVDVTTGGKLHYIFQIHTGVICR